MNTTEALNAVRYGYPIQCTKDEYKDIRTTIHDEAIEMMYLGALDMAMTIMEEVRRLDDLYLNQK